MMKKFLTIMLLAGIFFVSCEKNDPQPVIETTNDSMVINNDLNDLSDRLITNPTPDTDTIGDNGNMLKSTNTSVVIQQIAQLLPPTYNNETLQASHIRIVGNYAYVSYNTQGPRYLGGIDIVDISDVNNPVLISGAVFINVETNEGKDISSVDIESKGNNNFVWLVGAEEGNENLNTPAIVERYILNESNQFKHVDEARQYYDLPGYVGTDVKFSTDQGGPTVFATSGTGGGLTVLNNGMNLKEYHEFDNARSVDVTKDYVVALGGNPGHVFSPNLWNEPIGGANDPEAKSILKLYGDHLLVALGEDGLKCFDLTSNTPFTEVSSLPRPVIPVDALNEWNYVTNSVSVLNDWVYVANGEGGLDVAKFDNGQLIGMGNINLTESVNYVESGNGYVFVATGLAGLTILKVVE